MKIFKISSLVMLSLFVMLAFAPQLSAKHHHRTKYYKSRSSAFSFNLNLDARQPRAVEYNTYVAAAPMPAPAYYERVAIVAPRPYVEERVYAPYYREQVIVQRPVVERVYIQPQVSVWGY